MADLVPMHMGAMHPFEQGLTLTLAFAPFAVLGVVVWLRRRADDREAAAEAAAETPAGASEPLGERTA